MAEQRQAAAGQLLQTLWGALTEEPIGAAASRPENRPSPTVAGGTARRW
jgi:hypothetical protein